MIIFGFTAEVTPTSCFTMKNIFRANLILTIKSKVAMVMVPTVNFETTTGFVLEVGTGVVPAAPSEATSAIPATFLRPRKVSLP